MRKATNGAGPGGMLADDDDATSSSGDDDEEVEVAAAPAAPPAKTTAEPAKKKTSDAFGLAYTPYSLRRRARAMPSRPTTSPTPSPRPRRRRTRHQCKSATGDAPDLPSDKVSQIARHHQKREQRQAAGRRQGPAAGARRAGPPATRRGQGAASIRARTFSRRVRPTNRRWQFQGLRPRVLARTAAYRAPVAAAPDSNEEPGEHQPPEQEEAEEPAE